jgi:hypothetical protein
VHVDHARGNSLAFERLRGAKRFRHQQSVAISVTSLPSVSWIALPMVNS